MKTADQWRIGGRGEFTHGDGVNAIVALVIVWLIGGWLCELAGMEFNPAAGFIGWLMAVVVNIFTRR